MFWRLTAFPECEHHLFLSHCQEDRDSLVTPVYDRLVAAGVRPWLDREDYYYGRDSRTALRDGVLSCRHVTFFVTDAMLANGRGWCVLELGFTELLQANLLDRGGPLVNLHLPLFLVPQGDPRLPRSVWQAARDRGRFYDPATDGDPVAWCTQELLAFLRREEAQTVRLGKQVKFDKPFRAQLSATPGLRDRVTKFAPTRLPPAESAGVSPAPHGTASSRGTA